MPARGRRKVGPASYWPFTTLREHEDARRLASRAVANAIQRGDLTRKPCERCVTDGPKRGPRAASEAHHDDYAQPLAVRWLCRRHHREVHSELAARIPTPAQFSDLRTRENNRVLQSCPATVALVRNITQVVLAEMDRAQVSQFEIAKRLGISRQRVNTYFTGGIRTVKALAALADVIDCDVSLVFIKRAAAEAKAS